MLANAVTFFFETADLLLYLVTSLFAARLGESCGQLGKAVFKPFGKTLAYRSFLGLSFIGMAVEANFSPFLVHLTLETNGLLACRDDED